MACVLPQDVILDTEFERSPTLTATPTETPDFVRRAFSGEEPAEPVSAPVVVTETSSMAFDLGLRTGMRVFSINGARVGSARQGAQLMSLKGDIRILATMNAS